MKDYISEETHGLQLKINHLEKDVKELKEQIKKLTELIENIKGNNHLL